MQGGMGRETAYDMVTWNRFLDCDSCEASCVERFGHSGSYCVRVMPDITKYEHAIFHEVYVTEPFRNGGAGSACRAFNHFIYPT